MSKKKRKQQKNWSPPLLALIVGGVLLIAAALFFVFNGGGGTIGGTPTLAVDHEKIDYGDVKFGVNKTFTIKVTNTGDGTLRFEEQPYIEVLEGC